MTQDLKIAGKTLTPDSSDLVSSVTLPNVTSAIRPAGLNAETSLTQSYIRTVNWNDIDTDYKPSPMTDGYYYNFHVAVAEQDGLTVQNNSTREYSICPKNWRLPDKSGQKSLFNLITTTYERTTISGVTGDPLSFNLSGVLGTDNGYANPYAARYTTRTVIIPGQPDASSYCQDSGCQSAVQFGGIQSDSSFYIVLPYDVYKRDFFQIRCVAR